MCTGWSCGSGLSTNHPHEALALFHTVGQPGLAAGVAAQTTGAEEWVVDAFRRVEQIERILLAPQGR